MVLAGDPLEPRFKMTVSTAQAGAYSDAASRKRRRVFFQCVCGWSSDGAVACGAARVDPDQPGCRCWAIASGKLKLKVDPLPT